MGFMTLDMALTRYTPTGLLDSSFGRSGWMKIERGTDNDETSALAIQPDGAIVFAGSLDRYTQLARRARPGAGREHDDTSVGMERARPAGRRLDDPAKPRRSCPRFGHGGESPPAAPTTA